MRWNDPEGWYGEGGGRGGSGLGTRVHPWRIHVDVWQNQYNIVKLKKNKNKNKIIGTKSLLYNTTVSFMLNFTVTEIWFK